MKYPSPKQPLPIKLINRCGKGLMQLGVRTPKLEAKQLLAAAKKRTGLSDFGSESFLPNLEKLTEAFESEAKLSQIGRIATAAMLANQLSLRLQLVEYRKQRPEVVEQTINQPLFVLGLPRTGTTILYELLAQDPNHRSPFSWEVALPIPPPKNESLYTDLRIEKADLELQQIEKLAPGFGAIHKIGASLPQECVSILAGHFISDQYAATYYMPGYRKWSLDQDMTDSYDWHYQFLQHLQVDCSRTRWVLKTPAHLPYLESVVQRYPDAKFVQTHRAPMDVMGSISSLACTLHSAFSDEIDPISIGHAEVTHFSEALSRGTQQRDAITQRDLQEGRESRFYDVYFEDIISNPVAVIEEMYRHFNFEFTDEAGNRMQQYIDARPREKHGKHTYTLEQSGLSREKHNPLFHDYCQRYSLDNNSGTS